MMILWTNDLLIKRYERWKLDGSASGQSIAAPSQAWRPTVAPTLSERGRTDQSASVTAPRCVLDASAVLAWLFRERGEQVADALLGTPRCGQ
jgi:hypothetical protein